MSYVLQKNEPLIKRLCLFLIMSLILTLINYKNRKESIERNCIKN